MVKKFRPGLSESFTLDVAPIGDLGDYLDEPGPSPLAARRVGEETAPSRPAPLVQARKVVEAAPVDVAPAVTAATATENTDSRRLDKPPPQLTPRAASQITPEPPPLTESRAPRHTGPRREINMSPEALHMSEELLDLIRSGSGQRDTKANELVHALLLLAFEAKDELDPHSLPKRGRWGTPTARAYPLEIKNAFLHALKRKLTSAT